MRINPLFFIIIGVIVFLFAILNFYIGLRGWQTLGRYISWLNSRVYWSVFWVVVMAYFAGRLAKSFLPSVSYVLTVIGSYWLAAMYYFFLIIVIVDLVRLAGKWLGFLPESLLSNPRTAPAVGLTVLALVAGIVVYGAWNARHPKVQHYDLTIPKQAGSLRQLHLVMVSDTHLGTIIHNGRLTRMVDTINGLQPDVVLFAGDVVDENIETFVEQNMADNFRKLKAGIGVYACFGNHEYIGGHAEEVAGYLQQAGVRVLRDQYVKVDDSFYVVGRDDRFEHGQSGPGQGSSGQKELSAVMEGVDPSLPVILLKHQPVNLAEAQKQGVDLQLSGHTHQGQLFPNNFITRRLYEIDYGYLRKGSLQVIVSTGFGTWGPPIRVGNTPEIVDITLHFAGTGQKR